MKSEIVKLASELFQLLIESTKENTVQWIKLDKLNDYDKNVFDLVLNYIQKKLLNNQALYNENSYYMSTDNIIFVFLCFKNIISNEYTYEVLSTNNKEKLIVCSDYDEKNFSRRLGNLIKFQTLNDGDDLNDDVESIKSIVSEFQDGE